MASKELLRMQLKAGRRAMSTEDVRMLSLTITALATEAINWEEARSVHVYEPLLHYREVDTLPLVFYLQANCPDLKIATWEETKKSYIARWLTAEGLGELVSVQHYFDVLLVPLLGFNDNCHRIGFGGGFYDRLLAAQPEATTVGLCYESGHISFEAEPHDIALDYIITEQAIYAKK